MSSIQPYTAQRVTFKSTLAASQVIANLDRELRLDEYDGWLPAVQSAIASDNLEAFEAAIATKLGPTGFLLFEYLTYDTWLKFYTPSGTSLLLKRYTIGDPRLAARRFLASTPSAAIHAPVVIVVAEEQDGTGTVMYDLPSAGITLGGEEGELKVVTTKLDALVEGLVRTVTGN